MISFDEPSRKGNSIKLLGDIADLNVLGWADRIKSAKLTKSSECIVKMFESNDYKGESSVFNDKEGMIS